MAEIKNFVCKDCGISYSTSSRLQNHVKVIHVKKGLYSHISEYYDKYLRTNEKEGICLVTGEKTTFIGFKDGYRKYLNDKVCHKDPEYMTNMVNGVKEAYKSMTQEQKDEIVKRRKETNLKKYGETSHMKNKEFIERRKKENLEKYGVESLMQLQEVKDKLKKTLTEKYGGIGWGSPTINKKIKETNKERYGFEHHTKNEEKKREQSERRKKFYQTEEGKESIRKQITTSTERYGGVLKGSPLLKEKIEKTCLEKYGVINPLQNTLIRQKQLKTFIERYGGTSTGFGSEIIKKKIQETVRTKYGVENISQLDWVRKKIIQTVQDKYGVVNVLLLPENTSLRFFALKVYATKYGHDVTYNSKPELEFIRKCEEKNIFIEDGPTLPYEHDNKTKHYVVDFKIKIGDYYQLIEIKDTHKWWYESLLDGSALLKVLAAQSYSEENNFLVYKILFKKKMKEFFNEFD